MKSKSKERLAEVYRLMGLLLKSLEQRYWVLDRRLNDLSLSPEALCAPPSSGFVQLEEFIKQNKYNIRKAQEKIKKMRNGWRIISKKIENAI